MSAGFRIGGGVESKGKACIPTACDGLSDCLSGGIAHFRRSLEEMAATPSRLKSAIIPLLLALAYFATGRLGLMLPAFGSNITLFWLPTGIAVAALLRWGFRCWPGVALGAAVVNLAVGSPLPLALAIAVGNTLGPLLAAWVLRRAGVHPAFDRKRDILFLTAAAILGMLVSSGLGVASLSLAGVLPDARATAWLIWWASDTMGVIAGAPLVLAFTRKELRAILSRRAEFAAWLCVTALATWGVFVLNRGSDGQAWALAFVPLPMVAWAALRYGPVGTSVALIVISVGGAYGTATGHGPFFRPYPMEGVVVLWIFMATAAALGWVISALHAARVQATGIQRLFERALSDVSLGVLLAGLDRCITYANHGFARLTRYSEEELIGKSCAILQGPDTDPAAVERLKAAFDGDGFFDGEILNYRKDGTKFWNALVISPVRDESGEMTGFLGIQRDITKRKQAELALHQSEEHLRTIVALEPECVKLLSPECTLIEMNPAGLAMIEATSLDQVRGLPIGELIVPENQDAFAEMHRRVIRGETGRCEFSIIALKGTRRWVETHAVPYRNGQRQIIGVLSITRDVTARKEAAAERERSLTALQLFIDTVPAYISFVDADERYVLVNRRYEEYFGRPAAQIVGQRLCDAQPPVAYAEMQPHVRAALAGQTVRYQSNLAGPDGKSHWLDVQYVPRRGEGGAVSGFFVLVFDITETKQAELAVRESRSRLDGILNCLEEVVFSASPDGSRMLFISASAEGLYGHSVADFMANPRRWLEAIHPEDRSAIDRAWERMRETGSFEEEYRIIRPDGSMRWVHDRSTLVPDESGQPLRLDGIVTDITERRKAEQREAVRVQRLKQLAELSVMLAGDPAAVFERVVRMVGELFAVRVVCLSQIAGTELLFRAVYVDGKILSDAGRCPLSITPCSKVEKDGAIRMFDRVQELFPEATFLRDHNAYSYCGFPALDNAGRVVAVICLLDDKPHEFTDEDQSILRLIGQRIATEMERAEIIEERRLAEAALRKSEESFRTLTTNLPDVVVRFDRQRRHLYANPAVVEATGFPPEAFIGKTNEELGMPEQNTAVWKATLDRVFTTGNDERLEFAHTGPAGKKYWESHVVAEHGPEGTIESALVLSRDITRLRQAEIAHHEALHRLQKIASQVPGVVYQFRMRPDGSSYFPFASEAIRGIYRCSPEEIREDASKVFAILHPDDHEAIVTSIQESARDLSPWCHEYRVKFDGGTVRWLFGNSLPQRESDGSTLWHGFITDITERKQAEIEREQLDRKMQETQKLESLGVLAGGIAHDFNNLLTGILGHASIAAATLPHGSPVLDSIGRITEASLRAAELCKQMLAYSGRGRFVVQRLDLGQLVEQTAQMLQLSISKKAALSFHLEKGLPPVDVDATQIRQVIMNLVINASEAIGEDSGVISVSTGLVRVDRPSTGSAFMDPGLAAGEYVSLEVADTGCGMSPETQAKIFDPFFTTKFTGRGLGLAAVLGIIRGHKGTMEVHSEPGRGSTFKLLFPAASGVSEDPATTATAAAGEWTGKGTVLIVDDEEFMRSIVAEMIGIFGLDSVEAADGREAVKIFEADPRRFALVLLDLTMPHLDGQQTFVELRKLNPAVRVVLMSGFDAQEAVGRFAERGLAGFLQKPFTLEDLRTALKKVLA